MSSGYFHDAGGRTMALDSPGVLDELSALMARIRLDMVVDRVQPRRSRSEKFRLEAVYRGHSRIHQLVSIFHRDSAHDRVTTDYLLLVIESSNLFYEFQTLLTTRPLWKKYISPLPSPSPLD